MAIAMAKPAMATPTPKVTSVTENWEFEFGSVEVTVCGEVDVDVTGGGVEVTVANCVLVIMV